MKELGWADRVGRIQRVHGEYEHPGASKGRSPKVHGERKLLSESM